MTPEPNDKPTSAPAKTMIEAHEFVALNGKNGVSEEANDETSLDVYILRTEAEVRAFLREHPQLNAVLREAPGEIWKFFPGAPLELEVETDPEAVGVKELFIVIRVNLPGREAFETIKALDSGWWLKQPREVRLHMRTTLEWL